MSALSPVQWFLAMVALLVTAFAFSEWMARRTNTGRPDKDLLDMGLDASSTPWRTEPYCKECYAELTLTDVCGQCGALGPDSSLRAVRRVWRNKQWRTQYKYANGDLELKEEA